MAGVSGDHIYLISNPSYYLLIVNEASQGDIFISYHVSVFGYSVGGK